MKKTKVEWKGGSEQFMGAYTVSADKCGICFTWSEEQAKLVSKALELYFTHEKAQKAYQAEFTEDYYKKEERPKKK